MLQVPDFGAFASRKTPFWWYDMGLLGQTLTLVRSLSERYDIGVHYAVKANTERRIMEAVARQGFGADCVSGWEAAHAVECGFNPEEIVFAGVGNTDEEIALALNLGIGCFNCESVQELEVTAEIASSLGKVAPVSLRVNPNVDARTHRYVTTGLYENKFGIAEKDYDRVMSIIDRSPSLSFHGLHFHIGSQITEVEPVYSEEVAKAAEIVALFEAKGFRVDNVNLGGGLGVDYEDPDNHPFAPFETWFRTVASMPGREGRRIHVEPGRSIVAQCGSLITTVLYVKSGQTRNFLIVDAGMNDLVRPALYGAYHKIENMSAYYLRGDDTKDSVYDVVGPICESSDVFGASRELRRSRRGDIIAIRTAGAYGSVMSSLYNMRPISGAVFSDE